MPQNKEHSKLKLDRKTENVHCIPVTLGSIIETY